MNFSERLREERKKLGLSQEEFALVAGVKKLAQGNYEKGERHPDSRYLAAIAAAGADVLYILTGQRADGQAMDAGEQVLLQSYRRCGAEAKSHLIQTAALLSAGMTAGGSSGTGIHMNSTGSGNVQIGQQAGAIHNAGAIGFFTQQKGDKPNARKRSGKG